MRYMVYRGGYLIYPNLPGGLSFSFDYLQRHDLALMPKSRTNHVEPGTNEKAFDEASRTFMHGKFLVPLLKALGDLNGSDYRSTPSLSSLAVYTMQHTQVDALHDLPGGEAYAQQFDKCTLIISAFSRVSTLVDRIHHYAPMSFLGQILVIWNNVETSPPAVPANLPIPVQILQMRKNSLNNRFYPWPEVAYSCIINMVRSMRLQIESR
jgi:hypothetical protein